MFDKIIYKDYRVDIFHYFNRRFYYSWRQNILHNLVFNLTMVFWFKIELNFLTEMCWFAIECNYGKNLGHVQWQDRFSEDSVCLLLLLHHSYQPEHFRCVAPCLVSQERSSCWCLGSFPRTCNRYSNICLCCVKDAVWHPQKPYVNCHA